MRKPFSDQQRLDCDAINNVKLNLNCRDELIPILAALQHIYSTPSVRDPILRLIVEDVNRYSRRDVGREGFDDWQVLVLAAFVWAATSITTNYRIWRNNIERYDTSWESVIGITRRR